MTVIKKTKWKASMALVLVLMLLLGSVPVGIFINSSSKVGAVPNNFYEIVPAGDNTQKVSRVVSNGLSQSNNNIKGTNNKYKVGQYTYTGKYITYNSDFYDYYSNEEIGGHAITPASAISSGWSDPYTALNLKLQAQNVSGSAYMVDTCHVELDFTNVPDSVFYDNNHYLYLYSGGQKPLGDWPGTRLQSIPSLSGNRKILNIPVSRDTVFHIIRNYKHSDSNYDQSDPFLVYSGKRYNFASDGWNITNPGKNGVSSFSNTYSNPYSTPLYFGCFWLDDGNTNSNYGDYNNNYTSSWYRGYSNFNFVPNMAIRNDMNTNNNYRMSASVRDLVGKTTIGDGLSGKLRDPVNTNVELPYLNADWLSANPTLGDRTPNIQFPFYEIKLDQDRDGNTVRDALNEPPTYYQFNSRDLTSLYLDKASAKLYEHSTEIRSQSTVQTGESKGFFPYNSQGSTNGDHNNLAFGVKYEIPFVLNEDGTVKGLDATFEFMGDDDVWVFVDGNLVLDMGGAHKDAYGKVNFNINKSNSVLEYSVPVSVGSLASAANSIDTNKTFPFQLSADSYVTVQGVKKYNTSKIHTLTMYFMERGMWESDNFIRFNFAKQNILNVENALEVDVNPGFTAKTYEAANLDVFDYALSNTNITEKSGEYSSNGLKANPGLTEMSRTVNSINATTTKQTPVSVGASETGLFDYTQPGAVKNTLFERYDNYMTNTVPDGSDSYVRGKTDSNGVFGLLYGQDASFKFQFFSDSTMQVGQQNALRKQVNLTTSDALENKMTTGTRTVKDYYQTKWSLSDMDGNVLGSNNTFQTYQNGTYVTDGRLAGASNQFLFQNQVARANIGVNLTASYVNRPLTGALNITKSLSDAHDSYHDEFTIKVKFTRVFGQDGVNLDQAGYLNTEYTVSGEAGTKKLGYSGGYGTITLKKGQTATISKIPVGTVAEIAEDDHEFHELETITGSPATISTTLSQSTVTNKRKLGGLTIQKQLIAANGAVITSEDNDQTFPVNVTLTSSDFQIRDYLTGFSYPNQASAPSWTAANDGKTLAATFYVSKNVPVIINNIPYGTSCTVREGNVSAPWTGVTISGSATVNANNAPVTLTNRKEQAVTTGITVYKVSSSTGNPRITGAQFALYDTEAHARAKRRRGKITPTVNGAVYTFTGLQTNTTYYLVELAPPPGYTIKTEMMPVTTNTDGTVKTLTIENDPIPIVMPETGGVPFTVNLTFLGILAMSLAGAAMLIYKRKLQKTAVKSDEQGRRED